MNQQIPNITSETIKNYQRDISHTLSRSSVKRKVSSLNKFVKWANQEGYVQSNAMVSPDLAMESSVGKSILHSSQLPKILAWFSFTAGLGVFVFVGVNQLSNPIPFRTAPAQEATLILPSSSPLPTSEPISNTNLLSDIDLNSTPTPSPEANTSPTTVNGQLAILDSIASLSVSTLSIDNDINLDGNLKIGGVTRFNSMGRLASITGYYQDSGLFKIDQGAADWAKLDKTMTTKTGAAGADVLTLSLDESALTTGSEYDALVISRKNAGGNGYALFVDDGNVHFDGNVEYVGTLTDVSDARLKENLAPVTDALDKVTSLSGVTYNLIGGDGQVEIGYIAQDVQKIIPEAVSVVDAQNGYLGVSYPYLIPVITEAIKELQTNMDAGLADIAQNFYNGSNVVGNLVAQNIRATQIVSPVIETSFLSPIPDSDLTVTLAGNSQFKIQNTETKEVTASIDNAGNATFSGEVRANKLYATNLTQIEATLKKAEDDIGLLTDQITAEPIQQVNQDANIDQVELVNVVVDKLNLLLANTLKVDANGDVSITGNLYVAGKITTQDIETNRLVIASDTPSVTSQIESNQIESNAAAGSARIASGSAEVVIKNSKVSGNSLIYVTPTTPSDNQVLYIKGKQDGNFTVGFDQPIQKGVEFNWWVVDLLTPSI